MGAEFSVACCGNQRPRGGPEYQNTSKDSRKAEKERRELELLLKKAKPVKMRTAPKVKTPTNPSSAPVIMVLRAHDGTVVHAAQIPQSAMHKSMKATALRDLQVEKSGETNLRA